MKLIREDQSFDQVKIVTEQKEDGTKNLYIEGVYLQAEVKNRNNRVYPSSIMEREVNRYIEEAIDKNRAVGELNHPDTPSINLDRVSHKIVSLKRENNNWIGKAKIVDTPCGKIARGLHESGVQLGVSSRGLGSLSESNGVNIVNEDYYLVTAADIVADPSAPDAFVNGIYEGKEWVWENNQLVEKIAKETKRMLDNGVSKRKAEQLKLEALARVLRAI